MTEVMVYYYEAELRDLVVQKQDAASARISQADKKGWSKLMKDFAKSENELKNAITGDTVASAARKKVDKSDKAVRGFFESAAGFIAKATG